MVQEYAASWKVGSSIMTGIWNGGVGVRVGMAINICFSLQCSYGRAPEIRNEWIMQPR